MRTMIALAVFCALLIGAAPADGVNPPPGLETSYGIVERDVADDAFLAPSAQVAVVSRGRLVSVRAFGSAAPGIPATVDTSYRIASITKMVTAVAVLQLVERGQLHLDDRLYRFLPWFPHAGDITIEQLLAHASGIPDFVDVVPARNLARHVTPREVVSSVAGKPLLFKPGTSSAYSNTEYALLGLAIERATGSTLDAYEREYIFAPAGMTHTSADTPVTGLPLAKGTRVPGDDGFAFDPSWFFGSGDLVSTADDLARFDIALTNGRLLRRASLERMSSGELQRTGYGLGLLQMRFAGTTLVGHSGGLPGFGGANMVSLSDGTAIVALGNSEGFDWQSTMIPLLTALYPQSLRERPARPVVSAKTAALLTGFVAGLQRGSIDRNELSKDFSAALDAPTLAAVAKEFSSYGSFRRLVFVARGHDGVLQYDGIFEHACYPFNFTIAPDGKLATY